MFGVSAEAWIVVFDQVILGVYSNELMDSPKGVEAGAAVQLQDAGGKFLAWGYGNAQSLIAFRVLSRAFEQSDCAAVSWVVDQILAAARLRLFSGYCEVSHRLFFGEADGIPGLVIDCYRVGGQVVGRVTQSPGQVFVVQAHTAGADRLCANILEILKSFLEAAKSDVSWDQTAVVLRNDLSVRKLEGLTEVEPVVLKDFAQRASGQTPVFDLQQIDILVAAVLGGKPLSFRVDLVQGQKTGFFLDQFSNIQLTSLRFSQGFTQGLTQPKSVRILDLCSYVGQWGAQLSRVFKQQGASVTVVAVDSSKKALELARKNIEAEGASCTVLKADALEGLKELDPASFDLVIADPPALIKSRKDIPPGKHAYLQFMTQAMRLTQKGGGIVCCSCSALLDEEVFFDLLRKAAQRNEASVQWIGRGSPSPDHPMKAEFPEGRYLKCWIGRKAGFSL